MDKGLLLRFIAAWGLIQEAKRKCENSLISHLLGTMDALFRLELIQKVPCPQSMITWMKEGDRSAITTADITSPDALDGDELAEWVWLKFALAGTVSTYAKGGQKAAVLATQLGICEALYEFESLDVTVDRQTPGLAELVTAMTASLPFMRIGAVD